MALTDAEYRLLNTHDFEICLEDLSGPEKRTVTRLRKRGMLKKGSDTGLVAITARGQTAWWKRYTQSPGYVETDNKPSFVPGAARPVTVKKAKVAKKPPLRNAA